MFEKIFTKATIGKLEIANRLVVPAMGSAYAGSDSKATEKFIAYYEEKAKGGWGLIITEIFAVTPTALGIARNAGLWDDSQIPGYAELARRVHQYDSKIMVQLYHPGRQASSFVSGVQPIAPSPIPCPSVKEMPHELTIDEIHELVEAFGDAALRVKKAGFDGVQLHGAHGYLIAQFMSLYSNKRTDKYGGNLLNRLRFPLEIIANVRAKCGEDFPLSFRISADEFVPGGRTIADTRAMVPILERAGVDMFDISVGVYGSMERIIAPAAVEHGWTTDFAAAVKEVVTVPVMSTGRINDPFLAESVLASGRADLVGMGRASLADPFLPLKAREGRYDEIVQCIGCLQGCVGNVLSGGDMKCVVNPRLGLESELIVEPAVAPRKVVVVGGGPAGMEAAIVAAERGLKVELYEKAAHLGGQFHLASIPPAKGEIAVFLGWQVQQMKRLGVEVHLKTEATEALIDASKPDLVVIATGATPILPAIPGIGKKHVVSAFDVLDGRVVTGERVVVVGGGMVGAETANHLANHGKVVTVVEMLPGIATDEQPVPRMHLLRSLEARHVAIDTSTRVKEVLDTGIVTANGKESVIDADTIVLATGAHSVNALAEALIDKPYQVVTVGDAKSVRKVLEAIAEGFSAGLMLD